MRVAVSLLELCLKRGEQMAIFVLAASDKQDEEKEEDKKGEDEDVEEQEEEETILERRIRALVARIVIGIHNNVS